MGHALSAIVGALFAEAQRVLKGLVVFGLTRRPIILLALLVFVGAGIAAFFRLNIEAYPKSPHRLPANRPKRWSAITPSQWR